MIADQIEARAPACWASGRCCNFKNTGHLLYVTGLEAACTLTRLAPRALIRAELERAMRDGDCPFLTGHTCGIHTIKPLGCRVYFCDTSAQDWQQELSERGMELIRSVHTRHNVPYRYAEWRGLLGELLDSFVA